MIEFAENDGYLYDDGRPRTFIFRVDGKLLPCPAHVTIGEFYSRVVSMGGHEHTDRPIAPMPEHKLNPTALVAATQLADEKEEGPAQRIPGVIQRNDVVRYKGHYEDGNLVPDLDGDLIVGDEYVVLATYKKKKDRPATVAMSNPKAPVPIRLTVLMSEVELVRKGVGVTQKIALFEKTIVCVCGETIALTKAKNEAVYHGECPKCHIITTDEIPMKATA